MAPKQCDFCGEEFRFPDKPRKDANGRLYSSPGEYYLPFQCPHCKGLFCDKHRLPENHNCTFVHQRYSSAEYGNRNSQKDYGETFEDDKTYPQAPVTRGSQMTYLRSNKMRRKLGTYVKGAALLSILIIVAYAALNKTLVSDIGGFIEVKTPEVTSAISSLGETIRKIVTPTPVSTSNVERLIFKYTNDERRKAGLKELVWDDQLALIARGHSEDMGKNDFFSHTNQRGEDPTARAQSQGYPVRKPIGGGAYMLGIGENISMMPTGNVQGHGYISNDADSVARAVVESWMNSPGHKANILNQGYDRLGVGVAYDGTYYYSTQDFW